MNTGQITILISFQSAYVVLYISCLCLLSKDSNQLHLANRFDFFAYISVFFFNSLIPRGGYGKLVQKELEAQRQLVDYGTGSLGAYPAPAPAPAPSNCMFFQLSIKSI